MSEQKTIPEGYVTIATKVPVWISDLLTILAKQRGMEVYELLQLLVNGFITAAKNFSQPSHDTRMLIESLKMDAAFNKAFNFSSPTAKNEIARIVLILQQPDHHGFGLKMIDAPFMEEATETLCVDDILEFIIEASMKGLYKQLREIGEELQSDSMRETLTLLCDAQKIVNLQDSDRNELPGYGEYHDYGRPIEYGKKYVRKRRRTPDSLANSQQRIHFDDFDREASNIEADYPKGEHKGNSDPLLIDGIKPFDVEP